MKPPLYRYLRRLGRSAPDAEDLVQGYSASLLALGSLCLADRDRGRFRALLLGGFKNPMASEWQRDHRQTLASRTLALLNHPNIVIVFDYRAMVDGVQQRLRALAVEFAQLGSEVRLPAGRPGGLTRGGRPPMFRA